MTSRSASGYGGVAFAAFVSAAAAFGGEAGGVLDTLRLGDEASERAHAFASENSVVRKGGLDQPCRVIMPAAPPSVSGGSVGFTVRCDPQEQTYLTVRLWGGDVGETALYLSHEGLQLGSNHSDWPALDKLNWRQKEPRFPGRFFYSTYMLPRKITRGRERVTLRIVSKGRVYGYAKSYEKAQYRQVAPSQEIHAVHTHTGAFFAPPPGEVQGVPPKPGRVWRPETELGPVEHATREAQDAIDGALRRQLLRPNEALGLAIAYGSAWARQHGDPAALERVIATVDAYVAKDDVKSLGWFGPGELAEAVWRVHDDAAKAGRFAEAIGTGDRARGRAYAEFFRRCIDHQTEPRNRGGLTNQDIYIVTSVYRANMLLEKLAPERALPKATAVGLVHQAVGLNPYRGRHYPGKGVQMSTAYRHIIGGPVFLFEDRDYFWVTPKGSPKEHGYVPHYGELAHQLATLYELTGDEAVKRQAVRMIAARAPFRVMSNDRNGNACLRIEAVIGWRHSWYPGAVLYADQYFKAAALFGDPVSLREAQLFMKHGMLYRRPHRPQLALIVQRVGYLEKVLAAPPSSFRLPMRDDQPDFAWADEGIRAVAFKHGARRAWMALGWRGAGVNNIARVHFTEPAVDRIANIRIETEFTPSGMTITRPKELSGCFVEPGAKLVTDGEPLPLAAGPLGGMGDFYVARYGEYLVGMNCTADRMFRLAIPADLARGRRTDLISKRNYRPAAVHRIGPGATAVLHFAP
jgi:hypothetical protein